MRSVWITAAVICTAFALAGCPHEKPQPVPGPQSNVADAASAKNCPESGERHAREEHRPDGISWFQGTLEEAFSRRPASEDHSRFHY